MAKRIKAVLHYGVIVVGQIKEMFVLVASSLDIYFEFYSLMNCISGHSCSVTHFKGYLVLLLSLRICLFRPWTIDNTRKYHRIKDLKK